jgi:hypothetical protein
MNIKDTIVNHFSVKWITSGHILALVSLILLPFIIILLTELYEMVFKEISIYVFDISSLPETQILFYIFLIFSYGSLIFIIFLFPPYPFPIGIEKYFRKRGYENSVIEFEFVKNVLYFAVPIFLILTFLPIIKEKIEFYTSAQISILEDHIFRIAASYSLFIVFSGLLKLVLVQLRKKFRLFFAKGCFKILLDKKDEVEKVSYLSKGLDSYNKYLQKNIHLGINNLDKVYSTISSSTLEKKNQIFQKLCFVFLNENVDSYTLAPLRVLQEELPTLFPSSKPDTFLTQQPVLNKIKDNVAFLLTITPLIISIIEIYSKIK